MPFYVIRLAASLALKNGDSMKKKKFFLLIIVVLTLASACNKEEDKKERVEAVVEKIEEVKDNEENSMEVEEAKKELIKDDAFELITDMYTEPILMNPGDDSVEVVWFTENEGEINKLALYEDGIDYLPTRFIDANTVKMTRLRGGKTEADYNDASISRDIYRHSVLVDNLPINNGDSASAVSYRIVTKEGRGPAYTLKAKASQGTAQKILLTSDHQNKKMCAANIQKVYETVGSVDAIFINGDIVDITDSAYQWFDADNSFFRIMQGRADYEIEGVKYQGAPLLQNAPIYASIGNHDVMGVYLESGKLGEQFNNPKTREYAASIYNEESGLNKEDFIRDNSFNTISYEEIFSLPKSDDGDERYYAFSIGDVRVIVLEMSRIWRLPNVGIAGKFSEVPGADISQYGFGQFIFEPIKEGSKQLDFLKEELAKDEFKNAKYKLVMYHFDSHSLGSNSIPAYTDPVASKIKCPVTGFDLTIYDYPKDQDYIANIVEPLLEENGVNLLFNAHSHIWNRFKTNSGMNILETSNVGNNYGGFLEDGSDVRTNAPTAFNAGDMYYSVADSWNKDNYVLKGDSMGLNPIYPNVTELPGGLPYLASDRYTEFSILDTGRGVVDSYYFDTKNPESEVVLFDSFSIFD